MIRLLNLLAVAGLVASAIYAWLQATGQWQPLQATTVATGAFLERVLLATGFLAWLVWEELPSGGAVAGGAIVIACGLFILRREARCLDS